MVPVVIPVAWITLDVKFVFKIFPPVIFPADKLAVEISVDARIVPEVIFVPVKSVTVVKPVDKSALPVTLMVPVVILVDAVKMTVDIVVALSVPVLKLVPTMLVVVWFVLNNEPVVSDVVILAVPETSSLFPGCVVLIPTFPP